jgi:hypothetical protein
MQLSDMPHHVLALYGEIDDQVVEARKLSRPADRAVVDLVETMLPGSTGFGQAGWYRELERFANRLRRERAKADGLGPVEELDFPAFNDSVIFLPDPERASTGKPRAARPEVAFRQQNRTLNRDPTYAKSIFAATILEKIHRLRGSEAVSASLNTVAPVMDSFAGTPLRASGDVVAADLINNLDEINTRAQYLDVVGGVANEEVALRSLPCLGTLEESGGLYCSTLYTSYLDKDLSVDDIAKIIHPRNWPLCSSFFGAMETGSPRYTPQLWTRMRETIGAELDEYCLQTSLIFHFVDHRAADAGTGKRPRGVMINYDLDPHRDDDGIVEVDNGYLWITADNSDNNPSDPGVRVRSSKQERINGLSPTATSALGCILGWGEAAEDMLSGTARKIIEGDLLRQDFEAFPTGAMSKAEAADIDHHTPGAAPPVSSSLPPNFGDSVRDVQCILSDLITRTAAVAGDGGARWMNALGPQDVTDVTTAVGKNLTEWADLLYETAERNVINTDEARAENGAPNG